MVPCLKAAAIVARDELALPIASPVFSAKFAGALRHDLSTIAAFSATISVTTIQSVALAQFMPGAGAGGGAGCSISSAMHANVAGRVPNEKTSLGFSGAMLKLL